MKKFLTAIVAVFLCPHFLLAQTTTPILGIPLPAYGATNWNVEYDTGMSIIDTAIGALQTPYQGAWSSTMSYQKGQQVTQNGALYVSLISSNLGNDPVTSVTDWALIIAGGSGGSTDNATTIQNEAWSTTAPTTGQIPQFNGFQWVPTTLTMNAITIQGQQWSAATPTSGNVPTWNGSSWVFQAPSNGFTGGTVANAITAPALSTNGAANGFSSWTYKGTAAAAPGTNTFQLSPNVSITTPWSLSPANAPSTGILYGSLTGAIVQQSFLPLPNCSVSNEVLTTDGSSLSCVAVSSGSSSSSLTGSDASGNLYTMVMPALNKGVGSFVSGLTEQGLLTYSQPSVQDLLGGTQVQMVYTVSTLPAAQIQPNQTVLVTDCESYTTCSTGAGQYQLFLRSNPTNGTTSSSTTWQWQIINDSYVNPGQPNTWTAVQTFQDETIVPTPTNPNDAANKTYVDSAIAGVSTSTTTTSSLPTATAAGQFAVSSGSGTTYIARSLADTDLPSNVTAGNFEPSSLTVNAQGTITYLNGNLYAEVGVGLSGPSCSFSSSAASVMYITLNGSCTSTTWSLPASFTSGRPYDVMICEGGSGGFTMASPTNTGNFFGGILASTSNTGFPAAGQCLSQHFEYSPIKSHLIGVGAPSVAFTP